MIALEEALTEFLSPEDTRSVFAIKGDWGVGKTYFWINYVQHSAPAQALRNEARYASAFGAKDTGELVQLLASNISCQKNEPTASTSDLSTGEKFLTRKWTGAKSFTKRWVSKSKEYVAMFEFPWIANAAPIQKLVENTLLAESVVCIDDLERTDIPQKEILGLISRLTEELKCKVVLLFNEDKLESPQKEILNQFREKVFDSEFKYSPTIADNLKIIWEEDVPDDVSEVFEITGCANIRVMAQVKWLRNYLSRGLDQINSELLSHVLRQAGILGIIHFKGDLGFTASEAISRNPYLELFSTDDAGEEQKKDARFEVLDRLKFRSHALDGLILQILGCGYADFGPKGFGDQIAHENKHAENLKSQAIHDKIWRKYRNQFSYTQEDFAKEMLPCLDQHSKRLSYGSIFFTTKYLSDWGDTQDFSRLRKDAAKRYVDDHQAEHDVYDAAKMQRYTDWMIELIREEIEARRTSKKADLLKLIEAQKEGFRISPEDLADLDSFSVDQYETILVHENFKDSITKTKEFRSCLNFIKAAGDSNAEKQMAESINNKLNSALDRIKGRSLMDADRIKLIINHD